MGIQLFYGCLLGCSKKVVYRSLKILLIASIISLPIQQTVSADDKLGVSYNNDLGKNQIWSVDTTTGTKTLLQTFAFQSGGWNIGKSFTDENTGKLWMWDANDTYTVYDIENNTITQGVGDAGGLGELQGIFGKPIPGGTDSLISAETSTSAILVNEENSTIQLSDGAIADASGDNIIKKESDGAVHIGTNSFITREFGGKQEIYATNAAGGGIDLNVTNGSDLLVNGASVMGSIRGLTALSTAFSSVPNNSEDSRYQCGVGFGGYDGKTAIASGCAMRLSNFTMGGDRFDVSVNAAASYLPSGSDYLGSMPSTAIRAGVSIKFGSAIPNTTAFRSSAGNRNAAYSRQLSAARREISDLQNKVADLEALKAELVEVKLMMASFTNMQTTAMR